MNVRTKTLSLLAAASFTTGAIAGTLIQSDIAKDAKWLVHIDMEKLMTSSFSDFGVDQLKSVIEENNDSSVSIDVDMVLDEIKSLTAYGTTLSDEGVDGVLILKTGDRMQAIFDGLLAHQEMEQGEEIPVKRVDGKPYQTFVVEDELFFAFPNPNVAIASKSFEEIEAAYAVIEGDRENISKSEEQLVLKDDAGFFLMVTANGINNLKDMPPQARMLQKTKGGQLSVGESEGQFRANLILTTADREVSMQLYRIVQGMLALASFTQVENQSMMEIVNSVDVKQSDTFVELDFHYPVERLVELIQSVSGEANHEPESDQTSIDSDNEATAQLLALNAPSSDRDKLIANPYRND